MSVEFAIIGCGRIAGRHAENIIRYGSLTAVCDIVKQKADALAKKYNTRSYYSLAKLLENEKNINIASICTPNGLHATHAIQCLSTRSGS